MTPSHKKAIATKNQSGIQSLEIGLAVLDVLINHNKPMMLKDIAHAMQMPPAKSHRYLVSLIRKGYARQHEDGRYGLGDRVSALGHAGLNQNNIVQRLTHIANEIKDTLNCGVQIAKWFNEGPIVIHLVESDSPISIITRIGSRMPLSSSATGRLFASYKPAAIIKPLVLAEWQSSADSSAAEASDNADLSDNANLGDNADLLTRWHTFTQLQVDIRKQGYATVTGVLLMGINAISIPILLPQFGNVGDVSLNATAPLLEYAITAIGTTEQLPLSEQQHLAQQILSIAKKYQMA